MNLALYINELTSKNTQGDYVVFGLMGGGIGRGTIQENAVIVFIVVDGPLAYIAQMDWSLSTQKNTKPYQEYIQQCFENYTALKNELQGKNIPHEARLLVIESNFVNPECKCIWAHDSEALNLFSSWSEPAYNESLLDVAKDLIELRFVLA